MNRFFFLRWPPVPRHSSRLPAVTARSVAPDRVLACSFSVAIYPFCIWRAYIVQLRLCHHRRLRHRRHRRRREDCATASRLNLLFSFCLIVVPCAPFVSVHRSSLRSFVIRDFFFQLLLSTLSLQPFSMYVVIWLPSRLTRWTLCIASAHFAYECMYFTSS